MIKRLSVKFNTPSRSNCVFTLLFKYLGYIFPNAYKTNCVCICCASLLLEILTRAIKENVNIKCSISFDGS